MPSNLSKNNTKNPPTRSIEQTKMPDTCVLTNECAWRRNWRVVGRESKSPDFPGSSPDFPGSFSATSPEVLSLSNLTAIQRFTGSFPNFPGSCPDFPGSFSDFPGSRPLSLGSLTPSPDSQKLSLMCSGTTWSETNNRYMCITARQEHIVLNENFDRSSWDRTSLLCVMCMCLCLVWFGFLEDWVRITIWKHMVACGLEICKGVLSLPFVHESGQECVRLPAALSQTPKQHDGVKFSILLACTSNDRRNVVLQFKGQRSTIFQRSLPGAGATDLWECTEIGKLYWNLPRPPLDPPPFEIFLPRNTPGTAEMGIFRVNPKKGHKKLPKFLPNSCGHFQYKAGPICIFGLFLAQNSRAQPHLSIYLSIYIYMHAVGSISDHILAFLESISGPPGWINKWSISFPYKNSGFGGFLETKFSKRGSNCPLLSGVLVQRQAFQKGDGSHLLFQFLLWWLLVDASTRL